MTASRLLSFVAAFAVIIASVVTVYRGGKDDTSLPITRKLGEMEAKPLILVMGMPRSAGLSISNYFRCNGLKSSHYCCGNSTKTHFSCEKEPTCGSCVHANMLASQPPFEGCGDYDVFSQFDVETGDPFAWFLPQHFTLPLLHDAYPTARWILNTRDAEKWATNVLHWYSVTNRMFNSFGVSYYSEGLLNENITKGPTKPLSGKELYEELERSLERARNVTEHQRRHDELVKIYKAHTERVKEFASAFPTHDMIELNVDNEEQVKKALAAAFPQYKADCWTFHAQELDDDWKDFSLKL